MSNANHTTGTRIARAGFTLIELLAVILIIGILMTFLLPKIPEFIDSGKVTACKANLKEIHNGLTIYNMKHQRIPNESGVRFFATLISKGVWENSKPSALKLTCPGVDIGALAIGSIENTDEWFGNLEILDGDYSSYAGRDCKQFPLRKFPGSDKDPLVADDNVGDETEGNHRTTTCVLYASGSVGTYEIFELQEKGVVDKETKVLVVGPDSPIEELRKLSLD
jgi:prepilin-type N-terminal cleavage/methylation domain-containing protein